MSQVAMARPVDASQQPAERPDADLRVPTVEAGAPVQLSIVIVSWNVVRYLTDCLESICELSPLRGTEVIVVDNASTDGTVAVLRQEYPWVRTIASQENLGFARGSNLGLAQARGRFVLLLNPDATLTPGAVPAMLRVMEERPGIGMVGPRLCYPDGTVQIPSARRQYGLGTALWCDTLQLQLRPRVGDWFRRRFLSPYDFERSQPVEAISGAAMLVRREVLEQTTGFGDAFLHCGEDLDLCHRIRAEGWSIGYAADARITHLTGRSSRQAPVRTTVNAALSIQEFFRRCHGTPHAVAYRLIVQMTSVPAIVLGGLWKRLLRRESRRDLQQRFAIAVGLLAWREIR